jgi:hypothetical protein
MSTDKRTPVSYVMGPDGGPMTLADLPAPNTQRWVARRKAQVVAAVDGGLLSLEDACSRYALTVEEFLSWERALQRFGTAGLRATHVQEYRQSRRPKGRGGDARCGSRLVPHDVRIDIAGHREIGGAATLIAEA